MKAMREQEICYNILNKKLLKRRVVSLFFIILVLHNKPAYLFVLNLYLNKNVNYSFLLGPIHSGNATFI